MVLSLNDNLKMIVHIVQCRKILNIVQCVGKSGAFTNWRLSVDFENP